MESDDKKLIVTIGLVIIILAGGYSGLVLYSGYTTPFSVVMSQSMQHDPNQSEIGCIDTGDAVIVREPGKCDIQSYFEGLDSGHRTFGDYGSVIIYERGPGYNPVIHRAIVWLDYNGDTWSSEDLIDHPEKWECFGKDGQRIIDASKLEGTLMLKDITESKKTVSIDLEKIEKKSGFLTMGDNPKTNTTLDQSNNIVDHPISIEDIRSIPVMELPWIGTMKILLKNDGDNLEYVPNSLPSLVMCLILIFSVLILIDLISIRKNTEKIREEMEEKKW